MTDNRTTEQTTTERLRALLDERGVKTYHEQNYITWDDTNDYQCFAFETYERPGLLRVHCNLAPEQAIAATLGSEPDEIELIQTYDVGFRNGVMAVYQQLEGIEDYEELQCFIAEYWGEGDGNDEL